MSPKPEIKRDDWGNPLEWGDFEVPAIASNIPRLTPDLTEETEKTPLSFPIEALNASQRRAVEAIAATHQQAPELSGMASLAALAGAIGKSYKVTGASNHATYANVYVIAAADRSYGKGASGAILRPILQRNTEIQHKYREVQIPDLRARKAIAERTLKIALGEKSHNKVWITALHTEIANCDAELRQPPCLYVGSATGAALVESVARNMEQLLSYSPEAGDMVHVVLGRYSKDDRGDFDLFLSSYSVEPFSETRVGRGVKHLAAPCLSVCWLVQPTLLRDLLGNEEAIQRGLAARCLYVAIPQQEIPTDDGNAPELDTAEMEGFESILFQALDRRENETVSVSCDLDAREIFRNFHNETVALRNGELRDIQGELGRARENAIRLALGQCVADALELGEEPIRLTADHASRGVALARYSYDQFLRLLAPARESKRAARVEKLIEICGKGNGIVTLRDLKLRNGFDGDEVRKLVTSYPEKLEIITKGGDGKAGRPSYVLAIKGRSGDFEGSGDRC